MLAPELGKPRRLILTSLAEYYYLTADQLTRLLFRQGSLTYVQTHLKELVKAELVTVIHPPKQTVYGRAPYVYLLSRKGHLVAKTMGVSVSKRYRSVTDSTHTAYPLSHLLAVNEFLIKTNLFAKYTEDIVLRRTVHDKVLAHTPLTVQLPDKGASKTKTLIPDSWIDLGQISLRRRYCFCVEVNLTALTQRRWRETVRKYLYCLPSYKEQFGTGIITVLVSIQTPTDFPVKRRDSLTPQEGEDRRNEERLRVQRRQNLLQWSAAEARERHRPQDADMFRISSASLDQLTPTELFFAPHWYSPLQESPVSLLMPTDAEGSN